MTRQEKQCFPWERSLHNHPEWFNAMPENHRIASSAEAFSTPQKNENARRD